MAKVSRSQPVHSAVFTHEGDRLATAGYEGYIYVWDCSVPAKASLLNILTGHTREINGLVLTANAKHLISGASDSTLRIWNLATGKCIQVIEEDQGQCLTLALSPDGTCLAASGLAGIIRIYRVISNLSGQWHFTQMATYLPFGVGMKPCAFGMWAIRRRRERVCA